MDMRQLKYFVQIVESGSLTKASRQLFVAQSALSQQMARLEEEVGKPLLVRSARGVLPTPNGQALYSHARFMLHQLEEATVIARQESADITGRVTVGLVPSTDCVLGLPLLEAVKARYPGILLNVFSALPAPLEARARAGELDVSILFSKSAASELDVEPLLDEELFLVVPGDSTLVEPDVSGISIPEIAALPLVLSSANHQLRRRFNLELERANLVANVVAEIDSLSLVMRYVAAGAGATIQPMAATETYHPPAGWRCLRILKVEMLRHNYLCALPLKKMSASVSVVRTELKSVARRLVDSGAWGGVRWVAD